MTMDELLISENCIIIPILKLKIKDLILIKLSYWNISYINMNEFTFGEKKSDGTLSCPVFNFGTG